MHYNENADRPQAKTKKGEPLFKISFPKARKGECRANPHKTQPTFGKGSIQTAHILEFKHLFLFMKRQLNTHTVKTKPNKLTTDICLCFYDTGYVADLMNLIFDEVNPTPYTAALLAIPVPEDLSAQYEKPDKEEVIASFVSRFKQGGV